MRGACWGQKAKLRLPTFLVGPGLRTVQGTLQPGKESEAKQRLAWPGSASLCQPGVFRASLSPERSVTAVFWEGDMYHEGPRRALRTFCPGWVRTQAIGCVEQGDQATAVTLYR